MNTLHPDMVAAVLVAGTMDAPQIARALRLPEHVIDERHDEIVQQLRKAEQAGKVVRHDDATYSLTAMHQLTMSMGMLAAAITSHSAMPQQRKGCQHGSHQQHPPLTTDHCPCCGEVFS